MNKALINQLLTTISKQKKNPSTRLSLSQALGLSDRECRRLREQALEKGYPIISTSDIAGSYISYEREDIQHAKAEAYKRMLKELAKVRAYDRILENKDQLKIDELV